MASDKAPLPFGYTFAAGESLSSDFEASTSSGAQLTLVSQTPWTNANRDFSC